VFATDGGPLADVRAVLHAVDRRRNLNNELSLIGTVRVQAVIDTPRGNTTKSTVPDASFAVIAVGLTSPEPVVTSHPASVCSTVTGEGSSAHTDVHNSFTSPDSVSHGWPHARCHQSAESRRYMAAWLFRHAAQVC
jgi:hypothetical protein